MYFSYSEFVTISVFLIIIKMTFDTKNSSSSLKFSELESTEEWLIPVVGVTRDTWRR